MDAVLRCLTCFDSVQLLVYALETQAHGKDAPLVRFLYANSRYLLVDEPFVLHVAAANGCLRAVYALRRDAQGVRDDGGCFSPPRSKAHYDQLWGGKNASDDLERRYWMRWVDTFRPYSYPSDVVYAAARTGDLQVFQWLHHMPTRYEAHVAMQHAAHSRNLGMVQWIAETACAAPAVGVEVPFRVEMLIPFDEATGIMAWCVNNRPEKRIERFFASRLRGLAPRSLMYHHSSSKLYDPVRYAVCEGDLELLKLLHETRATYNWDFSVASAIKAAEKDHLKIVQWFIENEESAQDPVLVSSTMKAAIESHHLHIIEWLYASKIDEDSTLFDVNDPEVRNGPKQWVYGNFRKTHHSLLKLHHTEAEKVVKVAKWFHCHKGLRVIPTMLPAFLASGNFEDVKWLLARIDGGTSRERPVFVAPHQLVNACLGNNLDVVKYLVEDCGIWADEALRLSMQRGSLMIAKYLYGTRNQSVVFEHEISIAVGRDQARGKHSNHCEFVPTHVFDHFRNCDGDVEAPAYCHFLPLLDGENLDEEWCVGETRRGHDPLWRKPFVELMLKYDPERCVVVHCIVHWAMRFGYSDILRYLISTNQKALQVSLSWTQILKCSVRPVPILLLLLELKIVDTSVELVQWATKHHQMELLVFMFTELDEVSFVDYAACVIETATQFGHLQVLEWLCANTCSLALSSDAHWEFASTMTTIGGRLHVLQWLYQKVFFEA
ncbi:hypothetical protein FI667_g79, partial [Globisporangium splendens]